MHLPHLSLDFVPFFWREDQSMGEREYQVDDTQKEDKRMKKKLHERLQSVLLQDENDNGCDP